MAAPSSAVSHVEKTSEVKQIPLRDGKPLVEFTPDMNSAQRQEVIVAAMNKLRKEYYILKKIQKQIMKRRRKMVNAYTEKKNVVDKNIKEVDSILKKIEDEIYDRVINATKNVPNKTTVKKQLIKGVVKPSSKSGWLPGVRKSPSLVSVVSNPTNPTNIIASGKVEADSLDGALDCAGVAYSNEQLQIPVYPNKPTYCLCKEVSYGKMIACDNPKCPFEWFHFECVKITAKPKGKWFCPKCKTNKMKK